jgi:pimeloyl-ACP methyl ester carboxylesterase
MLLAGLALLTMIALGEAGRPPAMAATQAQPLDWTPCDGPFECATLSVPLDYAQPSGRQIEVALIRAPARNPSERIGVLVSNPGGPGASGIRFLRGWTRVVDETIQNRFDLVSFDPRGVGQSTPLLCHDDIQRMIGLDPHPVTADEWAEVERIIREFTALCVERGGDLLPHLGSLNVARDMDRIREALGEEQLTYVGYSYGTVLGALYAEMFPERVRAMVVDGPVDLSLPPDELNITQALGFERALEHFLEDCRERQCDLVREGRDPAAAIDELFARTREAPIASSEADRALGPGEALTGVVAALYRRAFWPSLGRAVQAALDGDGTWLVQMADGLWGRRGEEYANLFEANAAVNCLDYPYPRDPAHYRELTERGAAAAPRFGAALGSGGLICGLWPVPPQPIGTPDGEGAPPLLVIGTTGDPATPYEWALAARRDLVSSVLLTHEGEGHTAYAGGNACIDNLVEAYLLDLVTPEDGTVCGAEADPRPPATPVVAGLPPRSTSSLQGTPEGAQVGPVLTPSPEPSVGVQGWTRWLWWLLVPLFIVVMVAAWLSTLKVAPDPIGMWGPWWLVLWKRREERRRRDDDF